MRSCLLLSLLCVFGVVRGQTLTDTTAAFGAARSSGRPVLLIFSGSDWCVPCIQLEKQVFSDSSFVRYARSSLVLLRADFPQRRRLPAALRTQYEDLASRYNPQGAFPYLVLLDPRRGMLGTVDPVTTPAVFIT